MSQATLCFFEDGKYSSARVYQNSWGGSARIWSSLSERYLGSKSKWLMESESPALWDLARNKSLAPWERSVLAWTFDYFVVLKSGFKQMADDLDAFVRHYPAEGVDHLPAWAAVFRESTSEAIGLWSTSVTENLFETWDEEGESCEPYDLRTRDEWWDVYDYLAKYDAGELETSGAS